MLDAAQRQAIADELVALDKYTLDETSHIAVDNVIRASCHDRPCLRVCPACVYRLESDGTIGVHRAGCLECATCLVCCELGAIEWHYPQGGYGVHYRYA